MKIYEDGIERDATEEEIAEHKAFVARFNAQEKAEKDLAKERQLLKETTLAKLGLTVEEVAALLS